MKRAATANTTNLNICDIHSHLLPGIDDGSDSWAETMEMVLSAYQSGVRTIIATPHFLPWEEKHNTDQVLPLCEELARRSREELGIAISVYPGQELYYYGGLLEDLDSGRALTLGGTRNVLVEFAPDIPFDEIRRAVIVLTRGGYQPILAHFERFFCLRKKGRVREIKDLGAAIQSNIRSMHVRGLFDRGRADYIWLRRQYENRLVDYIGSDMHNMTTRPPITPEDRMWYEENLAPDYLRQVMSENGLKLLRP